MPLPILIIRLSRAPSKLKNFLFRSHLKLHKRKHTYVQCKCDICGQFLKSAESLHRHIAKSHRIPFQCEICGKTFKHKDTLKRHGKEHGELKYKCEVGHTFW